MRNHRDGRDDRAAHDLGASPIGAALPTGSSTGLRLISLVRTVAREVASTKGNQDGTTALYDHGYRNLFPQVRLCGAGGARTHDRGIMSPLL